MGRDEKMMTELIGGRAEALKGIFPLMGKLAKDYRSKTGQMYESSKALTSAWKEQTEGINKTGFAWDQFKSKIKKMVILLGDALSPAFMEIIKFLKPIVDWFIKLSPATKKIILVITGLVAAI